MATEPDWNSLLEQQKFNQNRAKNLMQLYKITPEYFDFLVEKQKNLCAICNLPQHDKYGKIDGNSLSVDLDKKTGEVRGLLCRSCKTALSYIKDDATLLQNMVSYLHSYSKTPNTLGTGLLFDIHPKS